LNFIFIVKPPNKINSAVGVCDVLIIAI